MYTINHHFNFIPLLFHIIVYYLFDKRAKRTFAVLAWTNFRADDEIVWIQTHTQCQHMCGVNRKYSE